MKYRMFVSDFDGTLVRADGTVSKRNIDAIAAYRRAGGIFAVCTGRMLSSIRLRLKELGLEEGLVVAFQGAQIADIATGKLLKDDAFSEEEALEVVRFLEERDVHIHIYAGEELFANRRDGLLDAYEKICGVKGSVPATPLSDMVASKHMKVTKALVMCMPEDQQKVKAMLEEKFGEKYFVTLSSEWLVEIMPKGQTKAAAIGFLSRYYHIPQGEIAAIGDQENDVPMLQAAGGRFAVASGVEALRRIATVVPSCEEDGVAYAIEHYAM